MAYHIVVEEILSREVIVEAETIEEAMAQVKERYHNNLHRVHKQFLQFTTIHKNALSGVGEGSSA